MITRHPKVTSAQARAMTVDYGIRGRSTKLKVRRALLFYALKHLGLATRHTPSATSNRTTTNKDRRNRGVFEPFAVIDILTPQSRYWETAV